MVAVNAWAHPHVFADVVVKAVFDDAGLVGIQNHWEYDEVYGAAMFAAADADKDSKLSASETAQLEKDILGPLAKNNYHNYLLFKSEFQKAGAIKDFKAKLSDGKLVIDFLVQFSIPATSDYSIIVVVVSDPTNYVSVTADMEKSDVDAPDAMEVDYYNDGLEGLTMMRAFRTDIEGLFIRFKK